MRFFPIVLITLLLSACFHNEEDNRNALELELFHPVLSSSGSFDELLSKPQHEFESTEELESIVSELVPRLINHLAIFNGQVDLLAASGIGLGHSEPAFKASAKPRLQSASECVVSNGDGELAAGDVDIKNLENLDSVFLDDKDDNGFVSEGDGWVHLISQCQNQGNVSTTTGTVYFSNFAHQQQALVGTDAPIDSLGVYGHFETIYQRTLPITILFDNFNVVLNREYTGVDVLTRFTVQPDSRSAVIKGGEDTHQSYAFNFDEAEVSYQDNADGEFETITFKGRYYDSVLDAYVVVDNLELKFDYAYDNNLGELLELTMTLNGEAASVAFSGDMVTITLGSNQLEATVEDLFGMPDALMQIVPMD